MVASAGIPVERSEAGTLKLTSRAAGSSTFRRAYYSILAEIALSAAQHCRLERLLSYWS